MTVFDTIHSMTFMIHTLTYVKYEYTYLHKILYYFKLMTTVLYIYMMTVTGQYRAVKLTVFRFPQAFSFGPFGSNLFCSWLMAVRQLQPTNLPLSITTLAPALSSCAGYPAGLSRKDCVIVAKISSRGFA